MTITLYELQPSPHARKVRLLAAELGILLNKVPVDPRIGETRTREYLAMNPNGRVPTLEEDGFVLYESPAILKYLSAKQPERGLCGGGDAKTQALIDQWICWWVGGAEAALDGLAWETLIKPKVLNQPGNDPSIVADAHARLNRFLPVLDKQLEGREYILGPLTVVDFLIGPRLDTAPAILNIDMSPYQNIGAWLTRLRARPYWKDA
jgi:glutathione S-transferase